MKKLPLLTLFTVRRQKHLTLDAGSHQKNEWCICFFDGTISQQLHCVLLASLSVVGDFYKMAS